MSFFTNLNALVADSDGNPVPGIEVTFVAPDDGASCGFWDESAVPAANRVPASRRTPRPRSLGAPTTTVLVTDANGIASATCQTNWTAGTFSVTASVDGVSTPATFLLTNTYPRPWLEALTPNGGTQGSTVLIDLTGAYLISGASVAVANPRISVSNVSILNDGELTAKLAIAADAALGPTGVTVTTTRGTSDPVSFSVTAPPLGISNIWPTSGPVGTAVTITGLGFGDIQGAVAFGGVTATNVPYWSPGSITAIVPNGAATGPVTVTVNAATATGPTYTLTYPPVLNSVSPLEAKPGDPITFTGTGFGADRGIGQVWLGTTYGTVVSWSDTQVVATVALTSRTGTAKLLQSGVWTTSVTFTVDTVTISSVSPNNGPTGTVVVISGSGFGDTRGTGTVQLGSLPAMVNDSDWSDKQITATVASGSVSGIARVQQGGILSNAMTFTVPASSGATTMAPNILNMLVGDTRTLQALDTSSHPVTGLNWTSSNPTIVSVSPDEPITLTALAPGHVTVTAGGASADVTVWDPATLPGGTLATGTVIWSNPGSISGVSSIVPAVPSPTGAADVFAFQNDGTVQAITADGLTAWTASTNQLVTALPDFQGGLILQEEVDNNGDGGFAHSYTKLDGITGERHLLYTEQYFAYGTSVNVHPDGTIFAVSPEQDNDGRTILGVAGIDASAGMRKFFIPLTGAWLYFFPPIVAGDGYLYVPYSHQTIANLQAVSTHLEVLRVASSGAYDTIHIQDWPGDQVISPRIITNADTGLLLTWLADSGSDFTHGMATITGTSVSLSGGPVVGQGPTDIVPILQAQDGSFVATATQFMMDPQERSMVAFDATGTVRWTATGYDPKIATADGGVIATDDSGMAYTFDKDGNATGQIGSLPIYSWYGDAYQTGSVRKLVTDVLLVASGLWPFRSGNQSANKSAAPNPQYAPLDKCTQTPGCVGPYDAIYNALYDLERRLASGTVDTQKLFGKLGSDADGKPLNTSTFLTYLKANRPHFYNGLKSKFCYARLTPWSEPCLIPLIGNSQTVEDYFKNTLTSDAETGTPSKPLLVFFRPSSIIYNNLGANLGNEGLVFHEALHGLTGKKDDQILDLLGYKDVYNIASCNITNYIQQLVLRGQNIDGTLYNPGVLKCPTVPLPPD
jgi:hypothetical protein